MALDEQPLAQAEASSSGRFGTVFLRGAWQARKSGVGTVDPRQICAYRFHHEHLALAVALLTLAGCTAIGSLLLSHQVAVVVLGAISAQAVFIPLRVRALLGRGAEVTPAQFSNLYALVQRCAEALEMPATRVFVVQDPNPNAFSFGIWRPYGIVLNSSLVEALEEAEMATILAHEMGHIKFGHTRISQIFGGMLHVPLGLPFVDYVLGVPFLWWKRCAELSADRAGYAASGRVSKVISALVKVAVGPALYHHVRPDELARQADEFYRGVWGNLSQLYSSYPFLVTRIQQIVDFAGPPEEGHELNLARQDGLTMRFDRAATAGAKAAKSSPATLASGNAAARPGPPAGGQLSHAGARQTHDVGRDAGGAHPADVPPVAGEAWLAVNLPDGGQSWVQIPSSWMTAGRGDDNDLVIADPRVSHRHLGIQSDGGSCVVHDLNSRNGTRVNGQPVRQVELHDGDQIEAGGTRLSFVRMHR